MSNRYLFTVPITFALSVSATILISAEAHAFGEEDQTPFSELRDAPPEPEAVVGGQQAQRCAWPTAVRVTGGDSLCTGTLVHPQLVIYAAHCGGGNKQIGFGETSRSIKGVSTEVCEVNPGYTYQGNDWAYCKLEQPVDLPITPVLWGSCERGAIRGGNQVHVVGFGNDESEESGTKRWAQTQLLRVDSGSNISELGGGGRPSVRQGDSGGPAFTRFQDGSYHVFGIASTIRSDNVATHALTFGATGWIESRSGIDITPCFDNSGNWAPTLGCRNFFAGDPGVGSGTYGRIWCEDTRVVEWPNYCGASFIDGDNAAPTVSIVDPIDGAEVEEFTTVSIQMTASDDLALKEVRLRFTDGGEIDQEVVDTAEPYQVDDIKFPAGSWQLTATAIDWAGKETVSEVVNLEVFTLDQESDEDSDDGAMDEGDSDGSENEDAGGDDDSSLPAEDSGMEDDSDSSADAGGEAGAEDDEGGFEDGGTSDGGSETGGLPPGLDDGSGQDGTAASGCQSVGKKPIPALSFFAFAVFAFIRRRNAV